MSDPFECVVSADLFRRALLGVSTEETRYYLNGVHVSPADGGGANLVATDGSFLIAMHDPEGRVSGDGIVLLTKPMKAALKVSGIMLEKRLLIARRGDSGERAMVVDLATKTDDEAYSPYAVAAELFDAPDGRVQAAQFGAVTIAGKFPDWKRVIPKTLLHEAPISPIDIRLLARAAEALSTERGLRVRLTSSGANDPVLVTSTQRIGGVSGFAIVMPLRHEEKPGAVPSWARVPVAEAA